MAVNSSTVQSVVNTTVALCTSKLNTTPIAPPTCDALTKDAGNIAFASFFILVMVVAVLGNSLVCIAVILSPNLRNNPTNYFVVSLAVSDIGFALFQAPLRISMKLNDGKFCFNGGACWMFVMSDLVVTPATIITLFVIASDRFYCIKRPFSYHSKMTKKRAKYIVALIWFCASIVAALFVVKWDNPRESPIILPHCITVNVYFYMMLNFLIIGIPLVIMGIMYFVILRVAISQIRAIKETEVFVQEHDVNENNRRKISRATHRRNHRELRATGTLALVYGAFVICWLPLCILNIIIGLDKEILVGAYNAVPELFAMIFEVLPILSSAINPVIYNFSNRQFRTAFKVVMYRLVGKADILRKATVMRELGVRHRNRNDIGKKNATEKFRSTPQELSQDDENENGVNVVEMQMLNQDGRGDNLSS